MKVLLDTRVFLWWIMDDPRLPVSAREIIADKRNQIFLSPVSGLEFSIKSKLGKLDLPKYTESFVAQQLQSNAMESLPIQMIHTLHISKLPNYHKDPFDRVLIAQSQVENIPILTRDSHIMCYPVKTIW